MPPTASFANQTNHTCVEESYKLSETKDNNNTSNKYKSLRPSPIITVENPPELVDDIKSLKRRIITTQKLIEATNREVSNTNKKLNQQRQRQLFEWNDTLFSQLPSLTVTIPKAKFSQVELDEADLSCIGNYRLLSELAEGHFSKVFEGRHISLQKSYALKCLDKSRLNTVDSLLQFCREIKVLTAIHHPNLAGCREVLQTPNELFIVQELAHCDLFEYMRLYNQHEMSACWKDLAVGMLNGLVHLHKNGIAHCDIKTENVLITTSCHPLMLTPEHIQLCDFGLSVMNDGKEQDPISVEGIAGTRGYMCPEMVFNRLAEGRQADMWSFGITMYEITTGLTEEWFDLWKSLASSENVVLLPSEIDNLVSQVKDYGLHHFLTSLLQLKPTYRLTAKEALDHTWPRSARPQLPPTEFQVTCLG